MSDFEIPKRVSFQDIKDILKAYYIEGAHREAVSTEAIKTTADMGDKVGRQTNFLSQIGLVEKEGHDRRLTDVGGDISEALMGGNESLAKSLLRETLSEWEFTDKIRGFVRMKEPEPVEENRLLEYLSANATSSDQRGRQSLLDLLVWVNILDESDEGYTLSDTTGEKQTEVDKQVENVTQEETTSHAGKIETISKLQGSKNQDLSSATTELSIRVDITPSDDAEDIESAIIAARRALITDVEEDS